MTEHDGPRHGEPGHKCRRLELDVTDALAGVIIRQHPEFDDRLTADSWSHGISKRAAASILRQLADGFDADADEEDLAAENGEAAEEAAIARAKTAGLN
jgi:hypothetical protein